MRRTPRLGPLEAIFASQARRGQQISMHRLGDVLKALRTEVRHLRLRPRLDLAQWEQAIEWCAKALWYAVVDIVAANAWMGRDAEARAAVAELLKRIPRVTGLRERFLWG
jgi:hypothetical protein